MKILEGNKEYEVSVKENGDRFWYWKGRLHRETGPAIELSSGGKVWYFEGRKLNVRGLKEFNKEIERIKTANIQKYYDVKVEALLPATLVYKVLASSPEEALVKIKMMQPISVRHRLGGRKELKAMVFDVGTSILRFVKNMGL